MRNEILELGKHRTLALMHGSSFRGDGRKAIEDLAGVIRETHGRSEALVQSGGGQ